MSDWASQVIELTGKLVDVAGVLVILAGLVVATTTFVIRGRGGGGEAYRAYRQGIGRALLLGLEILVAADVIRTVAVTPTLRSVSVLGIIVVIRTFLSWSLEVELEGRWPWQGRAGGPGE